MIEPVPPAFLFFGGALLLPWLGRGPFFRKAILFLVPLAAFHNLLQMGPGTYWTCSFLGYELVLGRVDKLSLVFGYIFVIISFLGFLYAQQVRENGQHAAAMVYVGSGLGVVFAGDLITVFIFWEIMALSSVCLIWYRRDKPALNAGFRYLLAHLFGGALLLTGILLQAFQTGTTVFQAMTLDSPSSALILLGFMLNAAVPPLNAWLPDAYPEGTVTGSVFLSAFTTKTGVYVLARGFAGEEILVWMGAAMAVYGVIYAFIENDIRRLLSYHIISQVGYMVCGVGLGSALAVNGSSAHAFCHILYKALLFMGAGAVIQMTGSRKITDLTGRGLYRKMPWTLLFYMAGAFSISAVPLFNGFISKNMVVYAAGELNRPGIELLLHLASVGTFLSVGLKLPWGTWFGKKTGREEPIAAQEPPFNMLLAMGLTSLLCILTGVYPGLLYAILPYPVDFQPYSPDKVVSALQLLLMTGAAFWLCLPKLKAESAVSLDTDWFYRVLGKWVFWFCSHPLNALRAGIQNEVRRGVERAGHWGRNPYRVPKAVFLFLRGEEERKIKAVFHEHFQVNQYRLPIGLAVGAALFFLVIWGLLYISAGG